MLKKSKSIEDIYEEVKDYDLVITNDAPLSTALNRLVDKPRLDYFSMTPRQIASKFALLNFNKLYSKAELIIEISKQSKQDFKYVHNSIEKIFDIWNNTGILEHCRLFLGKEANYLKYLEELATVELAMEKFDEAFYGNKSIAVIGLELFNELDRQVLPRRGKAADEISLFTESETVIDRSYLFDSSNELINNIVSLIDKDNQNHTAIVLDTDSDYLEIIKSRLNERGIKLLIKDYLSEDFRIANIMSFIEASFETENLKLKDLMLVESLFEININKKYGDFYFHKYIDSFGVKGSLKEIYEMMNDIRSFTYKKLIADLQKRFDIKIRKELPEIIERLDLSEKKINADNLNLLSYFLKYIDIELSETDEGVLFVNALNSAYIDRPVIIFAGLDASWFKLSIDKQYVRKEEEEMNNLTKFQILLSQGQAKYYFTLEQKHNEYVTPCFYFNMLSGKSINRFDDKFFNPVFMRSKKEENFYKPAKEKLNLQPIDPLKSISPTSLNVYFSCPKKYSYSLMVTQQERSYFLKGNLLHDFAEFYFNHPDYAKENFDKILKLMLANFTGYVKNIEIEKTVFTIGMNAVMSLIDEMNFEKVPLETPAENNKNFLFRLEGKKKIFGNTEMRHESEVSGVKGKLDILSEKNIIDFKTGKSSKKGIQLSREFKTETIKESEIDNVNFQTVAYITLARELFDETEISFYYFFLLSKIGDFIKGRFFTQDLQRKAKYIPLTMKDFILSKEMFDNIKNDFLSEFGYENYKEIVNTNFEKIDFTKQQSITEVLEEPMYDIVINRMGKTFKDYRKRVYNTFRDDIMLPPIKDISKTIKGSETEGLIFKDDIDNFVELVKEKVKEINNYIKTDFPNKPILDLRTVCQGCDYLNICIGNQLWSGNELTDITY